MLKFVRGWFYRAYIRKYSNLNPIDHQELAEWIPVVAAARVDENIHFDEKWLLSVAQRLVESNQGIDLAILLFVP